jgi:hypothetical protein
MIRDSTPNLSQGSTQMFRNLRDKGKDCGLIMVQLSSNISAEVYATHHLTRKIGLMLKRRGGSVCYKLSIVKKLSVSDSKDTSVIQILMYSRAKLRDYLSIG